jgi:transposase-like protein
VTRSSIEEVFGRVEELAAGPPPRERAEAIRMVADESGRSEADVRDAYHAARRTRLAAIDDEAEAPRGAGHHSDAESLFTEMLPLVEAGASVEQAARRFGEADSVAGIAAGFRRWRVREGLGGDEGDEPGDAGALGAALRDADARIVSLEAENRTMRRELAAARQVINRLRAILDAAP